MPDLLRILKTGVVALLAIAVMSVPSHAQSSWRASPMRYASAKVEREPPEFAFATEPASVLMSLPPLHLVELPNGVEEIRIWIGFGVVMPDVMLRITAADGRANGEVVYWWDDIEHPAQDTISSSFLSAMQRLAGTYGCNMGNTGGAWLEHRDGAEIEHRRWVFTCKLDFGNAEPNWDEVKARLTDLRAFDLPDPKTLEPDGIEVLDGISVEVEALKGAHYRKYMYSNPDLRPWPEAKFAQRIIDFVHGLIRNLDRP